MSNEIHKYYPSKYEAEEAKKKGERIYYTPKKGWYCVTPKKRNFWDIY